MDYKFPAGYWPLDARRAADSLPSMRPPPTQPGFLHRAIAVVCLGLVVLLGAAGSHAGLHAAMHASSAAAHHEDGCAVDLFAAGVTQPLEAPQLARLSDVVASAYARTAEPAVPTKPAGLHPPGRGPPLQ
jgi:hypothetical protein